MCRPAQAMGGDPRYATEEDRLPERAGPSGAAADADAPAGGWHPAIKDVAVLAVEGAERPFWRRYPREVALSFYDGRVLCWLVRPEHEWLWRGSAALRPEGPGRGADPATVAAELARAAEGHVVCAEAPALAAWWLTALFAATGSPVPFAVESLDAAASWTGLSPDTVEAVRLTVGDVYPAAPRPARGAVTGIETLRALTFHVATRLIREGRVDTGAARTAPMGERKS